MGLRTGVKWSRAFHRSITSHCLPLTSHNRPERRTLYTPSLVGQYRMSNATKITIPKSMAIFGSCCWFLPWFAMWMPIFLPMLCTDSRVWGRVYNQLCVKFLRIKRGFELRVKLTIELGVKIDLVKQCLQTLIRSDYQRCHKWLASSEGSLEAGMIVGAGSNPTVGSLYSTPFVFIFIFLFLPYVGIF